MSMELVAAQAFNGLVLGMIYVLLAMGLSIVWGMMDIVNFAHGLFYTLGAYLAYTVASVTGSYWACLVLVPIFTAVIGMVLERGLLRHLYGENILYQILMTYGVAIAGRELIIMIYTPVGKQFSQPDILTGVITVAGLFFPIYRVFVFVLTLLLTIAMWYFIEKTRYGSIVRAGTENLDMVNCLGINISKVFTLTFGLAMAIAGLSGVLVAPMRGVEPYMGDLILGICFAVVVIGGMGSFFGAVLGGLIVGLSQSLITLVLPSASIIVIFLVMAAIILIKPRGLLGLRD
jgi:branched-chain amino acid transport system permease protein